MRHPVLAHSQVPLLSLPAPPPPQPPRRRFEKTIRYASRKAYAEVRPRIKGRFATKAEVEAMRAAEAAMKGGMIGGIMDCASDAFKAADRLVPVM